MMDLTSRWSIAFFQLEETSGPVLRRVPDIVPVRSQGPAVHLWPPQRARRTRRRERGEELPDLSEWGMVAAIAQPSADNEGEEDDVEDEALLGEAELQEEGVEELVLYDRALDEILAAAAVEGGDVMEVAGEEDRAGAVPMAEPLADEDAPSVEPAGAVAAAPAPVARAAAKARAFAGREAALVSVELGEHLGRIAFHRSKTAFEATCGQPHHGQCTLTRTSRGRQGAGGGVVAGRPLGFLACWLLHGAACGDKAKPQRTRTVWKVEFTKENREAARVWLREQPGV